MRGAEECVKFKANGHVALVELLVKNECNLEACDLNKETPLLAGTAPSNVRVLCESPLGVLRVDEALSSGTIFACSGEPHSVLHACELSQSPLVSDAETSRKRRGQSAKGAVGGVRPRRVSRRGHVARARREGQRLYTRGVLT